LIVVLRITTWRGQIGATHFYGKLQEYDADWDSSEIVAVHEILTSKAAAVLNVKDDTVGKSYAYEAGEPTERFDDEESLRAAAVGAAREKMGRRRGNLCGQSRPGAGRYGEIGMSTKGIMAGRKGFMAEGKPGFPEAYDLRLLNNERRKNEELLRENQSLRDEIGRLNVKYTDAYRAVKKVFESAP